MTDPVRRGRPEAAAVIWKEGDRAVAEAEARAAHASARRRGVLRALGAFVAATILYLVYPDAPWLYGLAAAIGAFTLLLALVSPAGLAALERALAALGHGVGRVVTYLVLAPLFYLFFAPFRALFRRGARDRLRRRIDPDAPSYFRPRAEDDAPRLDRPY